MPSYASNVYTNGPRQMVFYMDQHHFRDGNVTLYKRGEHKKQRWRARYRIDGKDVTQSLMTLDFK